MKIKIADVRPVTDLSDKIYTSTSKSGVENAFLVPLVANWHANVWSFHCCIGIVAADKDNDYKMMSMIDRLL